MSSGASRPFISVKFTPPGRTYSFLLPEFDLDAEAARPPAPSHGDQVIVDTADGQALGTVTRGVPAVSARRMPPADSPARFVRRASHDDVVTRLKHQQRE
jgi:cell fate regulator YaaT (PSP1 superfamily)